VTCPIEGVIADLIVEPVPVRPEPSNAGGWALLALVLGILIFELWAIATGRPTISQWTKRITRSRPWWKAFGVVSIGLLLWHLFFGGPL
jgi:succinate dehydrogenase hydrophobic anchor subunit